MIMSAIMAAMRLARATSATLIRTSLCFFTTSFLAKTVSLRLPRSVVQPLAGSDIAMMVLLQRWIGSPGIFCPGSSIFG